MEEGNMAAMREALVLAIEVGDWCCAQTDDPLECCEYSCTYQVEPHGEAGADCPWKKIRAALAAPPRNCDRFETAEDAKKEFNYLWNFVWKRGGGYVDEREYRGEYEKWLFAPIQEGETNGSR